MVEQLGRLAEGVAGLERDRVGLGHVGPGHEPAGDPLEGGLDRPRVHPADDAQREEVLGPLGVAGLDAQRGHGPLGQRRHRDLVDGERVEAAVVAGIGRVARLLEVALLERVGVEDDRRPRRHPADLATERGRVHGHQHVGGVTRRGDVMVGDVDLEGRHPGERARGRADLGREVGQRREVVPVERAAGGEPVARELHAVARVAGEPDDDSVDGLGQLGPVGGGGQPRPP
jgi:hypothetical protein